MSVNTYSIPDAVSFVIAAGAAMVFYVRYFRNSRDRSNELLLANVLLATSASALINFFIDNIVPVGVSARSVPNAARTATWLCAALYSVGSVVLATMLHFMARYFQIRSVKSDTIAMLYGVVVLSTVFFFTPVCLQTPTRPISEYSGWTDTMPWQPQLTYVGDVFIVLWVAAFFLTSRAVWRQPMRQFRPGELRLSRGFVQAAFTAWYGGGFFDMISGMNELNIVAISPYCVAVISLSFLGALVYQKKHPVAAAASYSHNSESQNDPVEALNSVSKNPAASRDVFICHSSEDIELANSICNELENKGVSCWVAPRNILPGTDYAESIIMGIEDCDIVVLLLSKSADNSPHVHREVEQAVKKRKRIITFRVENLNLSKAMDYFLGSTHWLDAGNASPDQMMPELVAAIGQLLGTLGKAGRA